MTKTVETKTYADGVTATGTAPLPDASPEADRTTFDSTDDKRVENSPAPAGNNNATGVCSNAFRATYRTLTDNEKTLIQNIKAQAEVMAKLFHDAGNTSYESERFASRNLSMAFTHLEDAVMRAVKHVTA